MDLTSSVRFIVDWTATKDTGVTSSPDAESKNKNQFNFTDDLADGTAANQADLIWFDDETIAAGADYDIDLAGVLTDAFGDTVTFARVKLVYNEHRSTSTASGITCGGGGATEWIKPFAAAGDKISGVAPSGVFIAYTPDGTAWAVGAGATDIHRITNEDGVNQALVRVCFIGATA